MTAVLNREIVCACRHNVAVSSPKDYRQLLMARPVGHGQGKLRHLDEELPLCSSGGLDEGVTWQSMEDASGHGRQGGLLWD